MFNILMAALAAGLVLMLLDEQRSTNTSREETWDDEDDLQGSSSCDPECLGCALCGGVGEEETEQPSVWLLLSLIVAVLATIVLNLLDAADGVYISGSLLLAGIPLRDFNEVLDALHIGPGLRRALLTRHEADNQPAPADMLRTEEQAERAVEWAEMTADERRRQVIFDINWRKPEVSK